MADSNASSDEFLALQEALVGRYSLDREIGRGGMGVVYLAHEVALDRPVALKLLPPAYAVQPPLRERFLREARTAAKLSHPNIVPIHAVDEVGDFVFFAMAYIDGPTLGERIRTRGPLSSREAARVLREVSWALAYAHAEGVIHRDVKPDNILLEGESGRALVTDFGIAHLGGGDGMTSVGEVLGTAEFMSPEQASGEAVDARSDLYALGVVGFHALTGTLPFEGESVASILAKHISKPAPPVASVAPEIPATLAQAVDRCLRKDPADRFQDGADLAEALEGSTAVVRELPIPLRLYIQKMRALSGSVPLFALVGAFLIPAGASLFIIGQAGLWLVPQVWAVLIFVASILVALGVTLSPVVKLLAHTRRLLRDGYGVDDARLAMEQEVAQRTEEIRFAFGKKVTAVDHVLRAVTWTSALIFFVTEAATLLGASQAVGLTSVGSLAVATVTGALGAWRNRKRRDAVGEGWLKVLKSRVGDWLFRLGGVRLERRALAAGGEHRPTEMAIGMAADRLFGELPDEVKEELHGLPDSVRRLEADAHSMREHVQELDRILAEIGDPDRPGDADRALLAAELRATRDDADAQRAQALSALETVRLGLLRLHAGDGTVDRVTADLGSARDVSAAIEGLLVGREEVERLLEERRTTGRGGRAKRPRVTPVD